MSSLKHAHTEAWKAYLYLELLPHFLFSEPADFQGLRRWRGGVRFALEDAPFQWDETAGGGGTRAGRRTVSQRAAPPSPPGQIDAGRRCSAV